MKMLPILENKSILTPTGGFLGSGYTHSLNAYSGCGYAGSFCGLYCYVQHNPWITNGRAWGLYAVKGDLRDAYRCAHQKLKQPRRGEPQPLKIYMSSSTDPYCPQEKSLGATKSLLEEMLDHPPDTLVIQTHGTLIARDLEMIASLAAKCQVWVSITVETDRERIAGFPPHPSSPAKRIETLRAFHERGVPSQATISPLCPIKDVRSFALALGAACDRVIVDHYLFGDGSNGSRTKRTSFPQLLTAAGFGDWNTVEKYREVVAEFREILGQGRVLENMSGFNDV